MDYAEQLALKRKELQTIFLNGMVKRFKKELGKSDTLPWIA